jgi:hypothetical protein
LPIELWQRHSIDFIPLALGSASRRAIVGLRQGGEKKENNDKTWSTNESEPKDVTSRARAPT